MSDARTDRNALPNGVEILTRIPRWRVVFRPTGYEEHLIPSLKECRDLVANCKVSFRGWDYPHLSKRQNEWSYGDNWIASWASFMGHVEYWRFHQSGQFLHLFSVRERSEPEWHEKLLVDTQSHLGSHDYDVRNVPGFISVINTLYIQTEIFEFASRMCQRQTYAGQFEISISLINVLGFVLTTDWERAWYNLYQATTDSMTYEWKGDAATLIAEAPDLALTATGSLFQRFGWLDVHMGTFKQDQRRFRNRQY